VCYVKCSAAGDASCNELWIPLKGKNYIMVLRSKCHRCHQWSNGLPCVSLQATCNAHARLFRAQTSATHHKMSKYRSCMQAVGLHPMMSTCPRPAAHCMIHPSWMRICWTGLQLCVPGMALHPCRRPTQQIPMHSGCVLQCKRSRACAHAARSPSPPTSSITTCASLRSMAAFAPHHTLDAPLSSRTPNCCRLVPTS